MKKYAFTFRATERFEAAVTKHNFILRCMPGTYPFQRSYAHKLTVNPYAALTCITDVYGNEMYSGAVDKKHSHFSFTASGFVLCSKYLIHEPLDLLYLYPTNLTRPTPEMKRVVEQASLSEDPWMRAMQLCGLTNRILKSQSDLVQTTAAEAFSSGAGDAKDFAQVLLTLCRIAGIPARLVSGLTLGVTRPHCWVEVHCGGAWRALDPTTGTKVEDGYLKIANGPDFSACKLFREVHRDTGSIVGRSLDMEVQVTEHVITARETNPHA